MKSHSGWCDSVDWALACERKGCQFDSRSGHMPGLLARSLVQDVWEATKRCFSHIGVPLPFSRINKIFFKKMKSHPDYCGSVGWASSHKAQKVASLIVGQGICLDCGFGPWSKNLREAAHWCFSHRCFSPCFSLLAPSLKISKYSLKKENMKSQNWHLFCSVKFLANVF